MKRGLTKIDRHTARRIGDRRETDRVDSGCADLGNNIISCSRGRRKRIGIVPISTDQSVMPSSSVQSIVARSTVQIVCQCVAGNCVVSRTTNDVLNG